MASHQPALASENSADKLPEMKTAGVLPRATICADIAKRARGTLHASRQREMKIRMIRATTLAYAIRDAHPDDARQIMVAALIDLSAGMPPHTAFGDIREDARWWSGLASPVELLEYLAEALRELGHKALCLAHRKRLMVDLWESLPRDDRKSFLSKIDPDGEFRRTGGRS